MGGMDQNRFQHDDRGASGWRENYRSREEVVGKIGKGATVAGNKRRKRVLKSSKGERNRADSGSGPGVGKKAGDPQGNFQDGEVIHSKQPSPAADPARTKQIKPSKPFRGKLDKQNSRKFQKGMRPDSKGLNKERLLVNLKGGKKKIGLQEKGKGGRSRKGPKEAEDDTETIILKSLERDKSRVESGSVYGMVKKAGSTERDFTRKHSLKNMQPSQQRQGRRTRPLQVGETQTKTFKAEMSELDLTGLSRKEESGISEGKRLRKLGKNMEEIASERKEEEGRIRAEVPVSENEVGTQIREPFIIYTENLDNEKASFRKTKPTNKRDRMTKMNLTRGKKEFKDKDVENKGREFGEKEISLTTIPDRDISGMPDDLKTNEKNWMGMASPPAIDGKDLEVNSTSSKLRGSKKGMGDTEEYLYNESTDEIKETQADADDNPFLDTEQPRQGGMKNVYGSANPVTEEKNKEIFDDEDYPVDEVDESVYVIHRPKNMVPDQTRSKGAITKTDKGGYRNGQRSFVSGNEIKKQLGTDATLRMAEVSRNTVRLRGDGEVPLKREKRRSRRRRKHHRLGKRDLSEGAPLNSTKLPDTKVKRGEEVEKSSTIKVKKSEIKLTLDRLVKDNAASHRSSTSDGARMHRDNVSMSTNNTVLQGGRVHVSANSSKVDKLDGNNRNKTNMIIAKIDKQNSSSAYTTTKERAKGGHEKVKSRIQTGSYNREDERDGTDGGNEMKNAIVSHEIPRDTEELVNLHYGQHDRVWHDSNKLVISDGEKMSSKELIDGVKKLVRRKRKTLKATEENINSPDDILIEGTGVYSDDDESAGDDNIDDVVDDDEGRNDSPDVENVDNGRMEEMVDVAYDNSGLVGDKSDGETVRGTAVQLDYPVESGDYGPMESNSNGIDPNSHLSQRLNDINQHYVTSKRMNYVDHQQFPPPISKIQLQKKDVPGRGRNGRVTSRRKPPKRLSYEEARQRQDEWFEDQVRKLRREKELLQRHGLEIRRENEGSTDQVPRRKTLPSAENDDDNAKASHRHVKNKKEIDRRENGDSYSVQELMNTLYRLGHKVDDVKSMIRLDLQGKRPYMIVRRPVQHQRHRRSTGSHPGFEGSILATGTKTVHSESAGDKTLPNTERNKTYSIEQAQKLVYVGLPTGSDEESSTSKDEIFFEESNALQDGRIRDRKSKSLMIACGHSGDSNTTEGDVDNRESDRNSTTENTVEKKDIALPMDVEELQELSAVLLNLQDDPLIMEKYPPHSEKPVPVKRLPGKAHFPTRPLKSKWRKGSETELFEVPRGIDAINKAEKLVTGNLRKIDALRQLKGPDSIKTMGRHYKMADTMTKYMIGRLKSILRGINVITKSVSDSPSAKDILWRLSRITMNGQRNAPFNLSGLHAPWGQNNMLHQLLGRKSGIREMRETMTRDPTLMSIYNGIRPSLSMFLPRIHPSTAWKRLAKLRSRNRNYAPEQNTIHKDIYEETAKGGLGFENTIALRLAQLIKGADTIESNILMDIRKTLESDISNSFIGPRLPERAQVYTLNELNALLSNEGLDSEVIQNHMVDPTIGKVITYLAFWEMFIRYMIQTLSRGRRRKSKMVGDVIWEKWMDKINKQKYKRMLGMNEELDKEYGKKNKLHDLLTEFPGSKAEYVHINDILGHGSRSVAAVNILRVPIKRQVDRRDKETFLDDISALELSLRGTRKRGQTEANVEGEQWNKPMPPSANHLQGKPTKTPRPSGSTTAKGSLKQIKQPASMISPKQIENKNNKVGPRKKRGLLFPYTSEIHGLDHYHWGYNGLDDYGVIREEALMNKNLFDQPVYHPSLHWLYNYHPMLLKKREVRHQHLQTYNDTESDEDLLYDDTYNDDEDLKDNEFKDGNGDDIFDDDKDEDESKDEQAVLTGIQKEDTADEIDRIVQFVDKTHTKKQRKKLLALKASGQ